MGGSGGGGGRAGEVSWPSYVEDQYTGLLGAGFAIAGTQGADDALASAQVAVPYTAMTVTYPSSNITTIDNAVSNFGEAIVTANPFDSWNNIFSTSINRYAVAIGDLPIFQEPEPDAWLVMQEIWTFVETVLNATTDIPTAWETPVFDAPEDIKEDVAAADQIAAATSAYGDRLDDRITSEVLPRFEAGMRDINAVQSSAFVIGRAIIEGMADRDVANFDADLTYKAFLQRDNMLGQAHMQIDKLDAVDKGEYNKVLSGAYLQDDKIRGAEVADANKLRAQSLIQADKIKADSEKAHNLINTEMARHQTTLIYQDTDSYFKHGEASLELYKAWAGYVVDSQRIEYVMQKEFDDVRNDHIVRDARWDLDMVQIAGNLIASISGGTSYTPGPTNAQNALGGAFAGASIGARATGSAYGAAGGAILGGIGAYLMGR
jgi:hypothetical protein